MNNASTEFNKQLELDVLLNGLTEVSEKYVDNHSERQIIDEITIPHGITHIKDEAFIYFKGLIKVSLSDTVTHIGDEAFCYCEDLKDINIPDGVKSIGDWAFYDCESLTNITIPNSVTEIGNGAFGCCKNLMGVSFKGRTLAEVRLMKGYPWGLYEKAILAYDGWDSIE
jgi:hypothetical protein